MKNLKKIILAYSGGLDTSVILRWLQETYQCDICTFTADIGQGEELEPVRKKAEALAAEQIFIEDLCGEFVRDFVFPLIRSGAIYEGEYLLGTAIARPLIAKRLVEIADETGADAIAHGATGKGNDQVRFELGAYALNPDIRIIAPWREWELDSRTSLLDYAGQHGIEITQKAGRPPYSIDANLLHTSYEGDILEDPWQAPEEDMWQRTVAVEMAPDEPELINLTFEQGDPVALNSEPLAPEVLLTRLNEIAGRHGVGRVDMVENRYVGIKSRGCYETPGGTILFKAHRAMESITLDREVQHLKDEMAIRYATLIYNGWWWSQERQMLQEMIDKTQTAVNGDVRLKIFKGSVSVLGRRSPNALYDQKIASFEYDEGVYHQAAATGFIEISALRLKLAAKAKRYYDKA